MDEMHEVSLRVHHSVVGTVMLVAETGDGEGGHGMHRGDTGGGVGTGRVQAGGDPGDDDRVVSARGGVNAEDTGGGVGAEWSGQDRCEQGDWGGAKA